MNKRMYSSPELEVVSFNIRDVLSPSKYVPDPQDPVVSGIDDPINDDI